MLELATPADRELVNKLAQEVHSMHVVWRPDAYEMAGELYPEDRFLAAIQARQLYVAKISGITVGYLLLVIRTVEGLGRKKRRIMMVQEICLEESCRGQGIGQEMMAEAAVLARAFDCDAIQLGVDPHNDAAVGFYQKCGFSIASIQMQKVL